MHWVIGFEDFEMIPYSLKKVELEMNLFFDNLTFQHFWTYKSQNKRSVCIFMSKTIYMKYINASKSMKVCISAKEGLLNRCLNTKKPMKLFIIFAKRRKNSCPKFKSAYVRLWISLSNQTRSLVKCFYIMAVQVDLVIFER